MKRIILGMMAATMALTSIAQKAESKPQVKGDAQSEKKFNDKKLEQLNVSEDQKVKIKAINENFKKQMEALHSNTSISDDDRKLKRQEMMKDHRSQVKSILTPEQQKKAKELRKEKHDGKEMGKDKDRLDHLTKDLNLTSDQSTKIASMNVSFKTKMTSIRSNTTLTQDQKKEQIKTLMQGHRSDIESILTLEQNEQLKKKIENRPHRKGGE